MHTPYALQYNLYPEYSDTSANEWRCQRIFRLTKIVLYTKPKYAHAAGTTVQFVSRIKWYLG